MDDRQQLGDYFRNIISTIEGNVENLEKERIKYGRFRRFVTGIDKNLIQRRRDLRYYVNLLEEYKKAGSAI